MSIIKQDYGRLQDISHVGMIIHSTTLDTEDKVIAVYGGSAWEKIEGRFLLGQSSSYEINSTGGEASHTLTINEMPSHQHIALKGLTGAVSDYLGGSEANYGCAPGNYSSGTEKYFTDAKGGGQTHNNMPPYKTVYIWERTA